MESPDESFGVDPEAWFEAVNETPILNEVEMSTAILHTDDAIKSGIILKLKMEVLTDPDNPYRELDVLIPANSAIRLGEMLSSYGIRLLAQSN